MNPVKTDYGILIICYSRAENLADLVETSISNSKSSIFIHQDGLGKKTNLRNYEMTTREIKRLQEKYRSRITYLQQERNLGCHLAVVSAINLAFNRFEYLIVLEDDLQVSPSTFAFVEQNLYALNNEKYACLSLYREPTPSYIQGDELQPSLFFSSWGWVTSKRKWNLYKSNTSFHRFLLLALKIWYSYGYQTAYKFIFVQKQIRRNQLDSWAYRWQFALIDEMKYTLYPRHTYVANLGFDDQSTHTKQPPKQLASLDYMKTINQQELSKIGNPNQSFDWELLKVRFSFTSKNRFPRW
jgi:hypothetical protein